MTLRMYASSQRQHLRKVVRDFVVCLRTSGDEHLLARECCSDAWICQGWTCKTCGRGEDFTSPASPHADEETLALELGLDVATYRMLRQLEQREIVPEDYDLLGRLDDAVKPKTLSSSMIARFVTRTYMAPSLRIENTTLPMFRFGASYWHLPLHTFEDDGKELATNSTCFGVDFWKLSMPTLEDNENASTVASEDDRKRCPSHDSIDACGVCLAEFDDGDELRVLPCGHYFHQSCIDHWLLRSATVCPSCKQELLQDD